MPPFRCCWYCLRLLEQAEHSLAGLRGERQGGGRQLLAGLQREQVRAFLVRVGEGEVRRTGLQGVDQGLGEVLTGLHDREVRTEARRIGTQRVSGRLELRKDAGDRRIAVE